MSTIQNKESEKTTSIIHLPIQVQTGEIERIVNEQLGGMLYEDMDMTDNDGDQLEMRIEKNGHIAIALEGQKVEYRVPLKVWIRKGVGIGAVEGEGSISMKFTTHFDIDEQWKLVIQTKVDGYQWISDPQIKLGFIKLPVKALASGILNNSKSRITNIIDTKVAEKFNLQQYVNAVWQQLQNPILISEEYKLWLKIIPEQLWMTPFDADDQSVSSTVSFKGFTEVEIGEKPVFSPTEEMPSFRFDDKMEAASFHLNMKAEISYEEAASLGLERVKGEKFKYNDYEVEVVNILLHGQREYLVINTEVKGSFNGNIVMEAIPYFSESDNSLKVRDLEIEVKTKKLLHRAAAWLFKDKMTEQLHKRMEFPLDKILKKIRIMANGQLVNHELTQGVLLNGVVKELKMKDSYLSQEGIVVLVKADGNLDLKVSGLAV